MKICLKFSHEWELAMKIGFFLNFFFEKLDRFFHRTYIQILRSNGKLGFFSTLFVVFAVLALFFSCCLNFVLVVCWWCCFLHWWWCCFMFWWCCCYFLLVLMLVLRVLVLPFSSTFKPKTCCSSHISNATWIGVIFVSLVSLVFSPFLPCVNWSLEHQTNP